MNTMTEEEALNRVAAYCSAAEHCRAEVSDKLQKWGIAYDAIERILARLWASSARQYIPASWAIFTMERRSEQMP